MRAARSKAIRRSGALLVGAALLATTTGWPTRAAAIEQGGAAQVPRLADCKALAERLAVPVFKVLPPPSSGPLTTAAPAVTPAPATPLEATPAFTGGPTSSDTNVQVAGVDEPDVVETDGRLVYSAVRGDLRIVDIATRSQLSATKFPWADAAARFGPGFELGAQIMLVDKTMVVIAPSIPGGPGGVVRVGGQGSLEGSSGVGISGGRKNQRPGPQARRGLAVGADGGLRILTGARHSAQGQLRLRPRD